MIQSVIAFQLLPLLSLFSRTELMNKIELALERSDVLITSGGVSMGEKVYSFHSA